MTLLDDFEKLREANERDPEEAYQLGRGMIEDYINSLPEDRQQRLRGMQFTIDQTLSKYKDPVARMNKMVELFWQGVYEFESTLRNPTPPPKETSADVVDIFSGKK